MLIPALLVLLGLSLVGGGYLYYTRGYVGWVPAGVVMAILLACYFTGRIPLR